MAFGVVGNTMRLLSGKYFDLANPRPEDFTFFDIAGPLAKICRFGGQIDYFYSVAEHLWHCTYLAEKDGLPIETQQAILLHDAAEAFIGDVIKPLKIMFSEYKKIELDVEWAISQKFAIDFAREEQAIKKIDHEMLIAERRHLFSKDDVEWEGENEVRKVEVQFRKWDHHEAEFAYIRLADRIGININC
jgi:predicted HD phosphohydrolase